MPRGSAAVALGLRAARCAVEGTIFAAAAAVLHAAFGGAAPVAALSVALVIAGAALGLAAVLAETRAFRPSGGLAAAVVIAAAGWGLVQAPAGAEGVALLGRAVAFGILGEAFLARVLDVARGLTRWVAVRNTGAVAVAALGLAALAPGPIDRAGVAACAIIAVAATAVGLALARSAEELVLAGQEARGSAAGATVPGAALLLAVIAIVAGALAPWVTDALGRAASVTGPILDRLLYALLLPFGYVAAWLVGVVAALFTLFRIGQLPLPPQLPRLGPDEEAEALRQIEASRPFVVGAVELIVAAVALVALFALVERMTRERRSSLPDGATLDRAAVSGIGLGALLSGLRPGRRRHVRPPRDDGTPAGALRALYWRFLAAAERRGIAWRATGETPAEHLDRAIRADGQVAAAAPLVRAFETLRYGERVPDAATVESARAALAAVTATR